MVHNCAELVEGVLLESGIPLATSEEGFPLAETLPPPRVNSTLESPVGPPVLDSISEGVIEPVAPVRGSVSESASAPRMGSTSTESLESPQIKPDSKMAGESKMGDREIPTKGKQTETVAPRPVKPQDATDKWDQFLGERPHTSGHPRTGESDPNRIVSKDGKRSIRYGDHEMKSKPTQHHYHEETWKLNKETNSMDVDNTVVRVPKQGGGNGNNGK